MPVVNATIAAIFKQIADLLDIQGANPFRIRELPGFGKKIESRIVDAAQAQLSKVRRFKLAVAAQYAEPLIAYLRATPGVGKVVIAGSFRRMRETVGDLDVLATAQPSGKVMERFVRYEEVREVLSHGDTRGSVVLKSDLQVDFRLDLPDSILSRLDVVIAAVHSKSTCLVRGRQNAS